jgi:hypothetical protein
VYEEPRLREQDFGNFQPCSAEMERMWQERADYGHFFYRIPNGESAADAYDRVSGFNESLWRQFGEDDCASVYVLGMCPKYLIKMGRNLWISNTRLNVAGLPHEMVPFQCRILRGPPQCEPLRIPHHAEVKRLWEIHPREQPPDMVATKS